MYSIIPILLFVSSVQQEHDLSKLYDTHNNYYAKDVISSESYKKQVEVEKEGWKPGRVLTVPSWIPRSITHDCPECGKCVHSMALIQGNYWIYAYAKKVGVFGIDWLVPDDQGYFLSENQLVNAIESPAWNQARNVQGVWFFEVQYPKSNDTTESRAHHCNFGYAISIKVVLAFSLEVTSFKMDTEYHESSKESKEHSITLDASAKAQLEKKKLDAKFNGDFHYQDVGKYVSTYMRGVSSNRALKWTPVSYSIIADFCACGKPGTGPEVKDPRIPKTPEEKDHEIVKIKQPNQPGKEEEIKMKKSKLADLYSKDTFVYLMPVKDYPPEKSGEKRPNPPANFDCFTNVELIDVLVKQNELNRFTVSVPASTLDKSDMALLEKGDSTILQIFSLRIVTIDGPVYHTLTATDIVYRKEKGQVDFTFNIYFAVEQLGLAEMQLVKTKGDTKQVIGKRCVLLAAFVLMIPARTTTEVSGDKNMDKTSAEKKHGQKEREEAITSGEALYGFMYHFLGNNLPNIEFQEECTAWIGVVKEIEKDGDLFWIGVEAVNVTLTPLDAKLAIRDGKPTAHEVLYPITFEEIKSKDHITSFKILVTEEKLQLMDAALTQLGLKNAPMMRFTVTGKLGFKDRAKATQQIVEYVKQKLSK